MDNTNDWSAENHHNLLLMQFRFRKVFPCFVRMKPIRRSLMIIIKVPFLITNKHSTKNWLLEFRRCSVEHTLLDTVIWLSPIFISDTFIDILHHCQFTWDVLILFKCGHSLSEICHTRYLTIVYSRWFPIAPGHPLPRWLSRLVSRYFIYIDSSFRRRRITLQIHVKNKLKKLRWYAYKLNKS